ncbi:hypothetical protein WKC58_10850 [Morganella morganii]|uniref:hypothetical protein n=1 Tax=Morganella TaxID=581 RepID=UPI0004014F4F|nr:MULTISPECIES: hypothetical protein [Morganella]EKV4235356.1 hypothetical protein [Morganella morganii]ELL8927255.1 hypothetical protein [Morganella morganii]ELY4880554.1 hypothetical protein [Morganella morganii]ETO44074.1 hypothetical protein X965_08445 [Morganella sp. EGD-HP17]MBC6657716.1 hypothetical protein [Morganella morganii]
MIISIKNNWEQAIKPHTHYLNNLICDFLDKTTHRSEGLDEAKKFIMDVHHLLILAGKQDILESIDIYRAYKNRLLITPDISKQFDKEIRSVFNYNKFVRKTGSWNAYTLCKKSITRTCPYCNQAYAFSIQKKNRGFRPTLDHFYSKDDFPHLALVINNLIPSCSSCNSSLKGKIDFFANEHLNPLWDDEVINFVLTHDDGVFTLIDGIISSPEKIKINISFDMENSSIKNSVNTFLINERYQEMIIEAIEFATAKLNFEYALSTGISYFRNNSESSMLRFDKREYRKYLLGKLYFDIYKNMPNTNIINTR